jgi:hypothetical protein
MKTEEGKCELCGHHVAIRQKAHIIAEGTKSSDNILLLCPTCHMMFDIHIKPKFFKSLSKAGAKGLPKSWKTSIYDQGFEASKAANRKKKA